MTAHRAGVDTLPYATVHGVTQQRNNRGPRDKNTHDGTAQCRLLYKEQVTRSRYIMASEVKEKERGRVALQDDAEGEGQASHRRTNGTARRHGFLPARGNAPYSAPAVPHRHHL